MAALLRALSAEGRGCHERSEIVGKQRCSRFGDRWDVSKTPGIVVGVGPTIASFPVNGLYFDTPVSTRTGLRGPLRVSGDALGRWTSVAASLRIAFFLPRVLYLGVEGDAGRANAPSVDVAPTIVGSSGRSQPALAMQASSIEERSLGGIAGVSLPAWRFDFSLEVFGGFQALGPSWIWRSASAASAAVGGCWTYTAGSTTCPSTDGEWTFSPRLEPRAGIAFRLEPWVTLRALAGMDPLLHQAWAASALLEFHTLAYDGFYRRARAVSE
jgi:hypothetical protein